MKKRLLLLGVCISVFLTSPTAHALSWAYPFVVWDGHVYEVKKDEVLESSQIGKDIGKVKTWPNEMMGTYYGNASNAYPVGTKYYAIKGVSTSESIAIKDNDRWVKAVYIQKSPFHIMNIVLNWKVWFFVATVLLAVLWVRKRK